MRFSPSILLFFAAFMLIACGGKRNYAKKAIVCGIGEGQDLIVTDTIEGYFDRITSKDMGLQLRSKDTSSIKQRYIGFLQNEVMEFTEAEKSLILEAFEHVMRKINSKVPQMRIPDIKFVKYKGKPYGNHTWFTRMNVVFVPKATFDRFDPAYFGATIAHEIYHIWMRYHPRNLEELYEQLGVEPVWGPYGVLSQYSILNPDQLVGFQYQVGSDTISHGLMAKSNANDGLGFMANVTDVVFDSKHVVRVEAPILPPRWKKLKSALHLPPRFHQPNEYLAVAFSEWLIDGRDFDGLRFW